MYFFSKREDEEVLRISNIQVNPEIRGYNLNPDFKLFDGLSVSDVIDTYCETMRRTYLKKQGVDFGINKAMISGGAIHSLVEKIFRTKIDNKFDKLDELIGYINELKSDERLIEIIWDGRRLQELHNISKNDDDYKNSLDELKTILTEIVDLEIKRFKNVNEYSEEIRTLKLEKYVDGTIFNLGMGKIDLIALYDDKIGICDLKTGYPFSDNKGAKYQITMYALMFEMEYKIDVNWGCIIFPFEKLDKHKFLRNDPYKLIFQVDDNIRNDTLEWLDKMNSVLQQKEPPPSCEKYCLSREICEREVL